MAIFTVRVADLVNADFDLGMGPLDYPIFDEAYRDHLNRLILEHYMNYEIGHETESMFRFALNRKLREIMPYYNQRYESTKLVFDPFVTMSYTDSGTVTEHENGSTTSTSDSTSSGTSQNDTTTHVTGSSDGTTTSKSRTVQSSTPQTLLSGNEDYATSAADSASEGTTTGTSANDTTGSTTGSTTGTGHETGAGTDVRDSTGETSRTMKGYNGNPSDLLKAYRTAFVNIDLEIVYELRTLFMGIWDNSDHYTKDNYGIADFAYLSGYTYF